jgi:hypothetical protein
VSPRPAAATLSLPLAALCLLAAPPAGLAEEPAETARKQAQQAGDATRKKDIDTLLALTYPPVLEMMGGKAKAKEIIVKGMADMEKDGFRIGPTTAHRGEQLVKVKDTLYCVVPLDMEISAPQGRLRSRSFMLGISRDGGARWTFVSGSQLTPEMMRKLFPEIGEKIKMPVQKGPELVPN